MSEAGVNRCLLLTDGLANQGITDHDTLARHASELRLRGVSTTTFGVGNDFDEVLLQALASAGGGHFYYIASAAAIQDLITSEVGETLDIVAREVVVEVATPAGIQVESLSPYPTRDSHGRTGIVIGDLASDQQISIVLRLNFPYGQLGYSTGVVLSVSDRDDVLVEGAVKLSWEYATDQANDAQQRDLNVDRAVARTFASRARQEAVVLNRAGDYAAAEHIVESTARRIRKYAGRDAELRKVISELEQESVQFNAPMAPQALKVAHAASLYSLQSRAYDGKANKGPNSQA